MNSHMSLFYETNLRKYYSLLDTEISKSLLYEKNHQDEIISSLDNIFSLAQKTTKEYIIYLTLNEKNYQKKIKDAEKKLNEYKSKIKEIKEKHKEKEIIPKYKKEDMIKSITSYDKMNQAIRATTDIENMSGKILVNLDEQTKGMKNTSSKILNINLNLDESKDELNEMLIKQNSDKRIIILFGSFLSLIIFILFVFKLYKKCSK